MKEGDTVFTLCHSGNILRGILGKETTAQGFYTRWGNGHTVRFPTNKNSSVIADYNDEDIFTTEESAKKELFSRRLRWPRLWSSK